jgi:2',3'-cyclic-nucleotide 2'-phosphodiesterase (5'-nucleotidase family)
VERKSGKVVASHLEEPHDLCVTGAAESCRPGDYEGRPVLASEDVVRLNAPAFAAAQQKGDELLSVDVLRPLPHNRSHESALGNLLADLMRAASPCRVGVGGLCPPKPERVRPSEASGVAGGGQGPKDWKPSQGFHNNDVAMINGGGMRAPLPAGKLNYGRLYETFPFDNAFASMRLPAGEFRRLLARSLGRSGSLVSLSGLRALARCKDGAVDLTLVRPDGSPIRDAEMLDLTTTDFLATGGDGFFAGAYIDFEIGPPIRDAMADALRARGGTLDPADPSLFDPAHRRIELPGDVPLDCAH